MARARVSLILYLLSVTCYTLAQSPIKDSTIVCSYGTYNGHWYDGLDILGDSDQAVYAVETGNIDHVDGSGYRQTIYFRSITDKIYEYTH